MPLLQQLIDQYHLNDVFHSDDFGLYYSPSHTRTVDFGSVLGKKKAMEYLNFLVCVDLDLLYYVPPLVMDTTHRRGALKVKREKN